MQQPETAHYDAHYSQFSSQLYAEIRAEAFGEDIGQNSWLTADEHDLFIRWLELGSQSQLLEIACGSGATTLRIARLTGCAVRGIDINPHAIAAAQAAANDAELNGRADFQLGDASQPLPFADRSFDALICIDAVNHLPDRAAVFAEWARVLVPGGRLVFTDPIIVTGPLTADEIAIRSSIGFFLFVPAGLDEHLLQQAGFDVTETADRTENMAAMAQRRLVAREARAEDLRRIEGDATFEGTQQFFRVAATIAAERRLSRFAFRAIRR